MIESETRKHIGIWGLDEDEPDVDTTSIEWDLAGEVCVVQCTMLPIGSIPR